jgi:translation initiation factor 1 (eIF-1/SUI1)
MNPFENTEDNTPLTITIPELWVEVRGRKKNTFICGLPFTKEELNNHLKILKKTLSCNGSLKEKEHNEKNQYIIQVQGDHLSEIHLYFVNNGVTNIKINGK